MKDLRSAIFYFENVADAKDDLERGILIQATTQKLKGILTAIEEGIKGSNSFYPSESAITMMSTATNEKIDALRTQAETLLECEELQRFKASSKSSSLPYDTLNVCLCSLV